MSYVKRKILAQWLALSFLVLSVCVYAYGWIVTPNENYFARSLSAKLQTSQDIIRKEIFTIKKQLEALPNGPDPMQLPSSPALKKIGASLYVLEGGEMIYWSDVPRLTPAQCLQLGEDLVLFRWTDGYYLAKRTIYQGRSYVSLQLLRHQYPYQNQYLENTYNPYWGIPENYSIAPSTEQGIVIRLNALSAPIFSIVGDPKQNMVSYIWWSFWLLFSAVVVVFYTRFRKRMRRPLPLLIWTLVMVSIRYASLYFDFPSTQKFALFDPSVCALDHAGVTMGYVLQDAFFLMWIGIPWVLLLTRRTISKKLHDARFRIVYSILGTLLLQIFFFWILDITHHFVMDSTFEMVPHKVLHLNAYSILAYCIIAFMLFLYLAFESMLGYIYPALKHPYLLLVRIGFALIVFGMCGRRDGSVMFLGAFLMAGMSIIFSYRKFLYKTGYYIIMIVISAFLVLVVTHHAAIKTQYMSECIAKRLANERDPVVEYRMMQMSNALRFETSMWTELNPSENLVTDTLRRRYFSSDAFSPYMVSFTLCRKKEHLLIEDSKTEVSCSDFFRQRIANKGEQVGQSCFWFLPNPESNTEYLGVVPIPQSHQHDSVFLYIECYRIDNFGKLGYPELLSNQDQDSWRQFENMGYSYALYRNNRLIRSFGDYVYPRKRMIPKSQLESERFHIRQNGYNHQFFFEKNDMNIVVSYPSMKIIELVFSFAYTFMFIFLIFNFLWFTFGLQRVQLQSVESRMRVMLTVWITVLLIAISAIAINLYRETYKQEGWNRSKSKMKSLISAYHRTFGDLTLSEMDPAVLNNWMVNTSNFMLSDINLYAINGDFIGTSRKEVIGKGFIGYKMNPEAYRAMRQTLPQRWVHQEQIGKLKFVSIYAPLVNPSGKLLGYANILHFQDRGEMNRSLTEVIASYVNIYVLFLLLTLPLSRLISYTVSIPQIRLREKMTRFQLSRKPEQIIYHGDDEFGVLVRAYNRMVVQLNASASRLAASERDAAWREMARQIAHEIKNPLTPMLLSIQHLMRLKAANAPGWEKNLDKVAVTLQEQIELLSKTASEFSDFAKMQETDYEEVDLRALLESVIPLYESYHNISLELTLPPKPVLLMVSREQLQRVLVNFMNNAVQAIGDNPLGRIQIIVDVLGHECRLVVRDNGVGIPAEHMGRLFQPYFTTKNGGTGLGLPISKRIIQNFGGEIFYHSENGKGASFGFIIPYFIKDEK